MSIQDQDIADLNSEIVDTYMTLLALWQERVRRMQTQQRNARTLDAIDIHLAVSTQLDTLKREVQGATRDALQGIMDETGETTLDTAIGKAYVTSPYFTTVYDRNSLDLLCEHDEALKERLAPFRIQRPVSGSLRIERRS